MSRLAALKAASSLVDVAPLFGMPASAIAFTLYKIPLQAKYTTFTIPKKNGGTRTIKAPIDRLNKLQRELADLLTDCRKEIEEKASKKVVSHGFRSGASIFTNARQHLKRRYVLNLDLENFFPTFNFGRVRGYFIKNSNFALHDKVATVIAQIACDGTALPQGSPCSPIISDLLAHLLDVKMLELARKFKCTYSRYADDITFSTNRREFPFELAYQLAKNSSAWVLGDALLGQINRSGFSVNHKKTRMQYRDSRQVVTGLTVNTKVNIRADYYRSTSNMCSGLFATGTFHRKGDIPDTQGNLPKRTLAQLEGMLSHIYQIKSFERLRSPPPKPIPNDPRRHGIDLLYDRFLFYRRFVILTKPLIICEGSTDSIYLDAAVRHLPYNALFNVQNGKKVSAIQYFNYSNTTREVMGLGGGASYFVKLIHRYGEMVDHFKHAPLAHPVILLVDNDDGPKGKNGVFTAVPHANITHKTTAPFYRLVRNLYLIKTPENTTSQNWHSTIEDFFKQVTRDIKVDGKTFNPGKIDPNTEYGKKVFAERVVAPKAGSIDFSDFAPLLDRIVAAIAHHATLVAAGGV